MTQPERSDSGQICVTCGKIVAAPGEVKINRGVDTDGQALFFHGESHQPFSGYVWLDTFGQWWGRERQSEMDKSDSP